MFKSEEQVKAFIDKLEIFIESIVHVKVFRSQGLDEAAAATVPILNKQRSELEDFIMAINNLHSTSGLTNESDLSCPDCGGEMILRTNRTNGDKFYGCKKYPNCRGTRDENGLSKADKDEAKYRKTEIDQQDGYSFNKKRNVISESGPE